MKDGKKCKNHFNECPFRLYVDVVLVMTPVANWVLGSKNKSNLDKRNKSAVDGRTDGRTHTHTTHTLITANYILPWHYLMH